jgi:hypothetical protein
LLILRLNHFLLVQTSLDPNRLSVFV